MVVNSSLYSISEDKPSGLIFYRNILEKNLFYYNNSENRRRKFWNSEVVFTVNLVMRDPGRGAGRRLGEHLWGRQAWHALLGVRPSGMQRYRTWS